MWNIQTASILNPRTLAPFSKKTRTPSWHEPPRKGFEDYFFTQKRNASSKEIVGWQNVERMNALPSQYDQLGTTFPLFSVRV